MIGGPVELAIVVALIMLLFGARKLPRIARGVGRAPGEFWRGRREDNRSEDN